MSWTELYRSKIKTAEEALASVQSGQRVVIHSGVSVPEPLVAALAARAPQLRGVEVVHSVTIGELATARPELACHFRHNTVFTGPNVRGAVQSGRADFIPIFLGEVEALFRSGAMPVDVAMLQCTAPDRYGYMSLGPSVDISLTAAQCAKHLIVQVNEHVPRTFGDAFVHISRADAIVEISAPLAEHTGGGATPVHHEIARHIANLGPEGATVQTGIGGLPSAVLLALRHHRDLGVHTEMLTDEIIDLIESGVVNNERKTLHPHKAIVGFVLGTRRIFEYLDNNPFFEFHPNSYTNDPFVIAQNDRMVAINSALEIDLTGQVCADSIGHTIFSGIGGQVDFMRGAARSKGGIPIIALPATARDGKVSRIVPELQPGAGVVTSRGDVHYVITEHGVAYLHGKSLRQRAEALIQIAAPEFRGDLLEEAKRIQLVGAGHF